MYSSLSRLFIALGLIGVLGLSACGAANPDAPEARVHALLAQLEEVVEARDVTALKDLFSDAYRDERGRGKKQAVDLAAVYFLQNRSIHLITRLDTLAFSADSTEAEARVFVAMTGRALKSTDVLGRAALYRFDVAMAYEGEDAWRISRAQWQRAETNAIF